MDTDILRLTRTYGLEEIVLDVDEALYKNLSMSGWIVNEHAQCMTFRMDVFPNEICFDTIKISDEHSRHLEGSTKYLETKGINLSTISILFDYLKNGVIPRKDEFPFAIKNGHEKGTLSLKRKCEDEVILVEVKAIGEDKILDQLAEYEANDLVRPCRDSLELHYLHQIEDFMFDEDEDVENVEKVGDYIGCLLMTVRVYFGHKNCRCLKLIVFAFPDQIAVPSIVFTDHSNAGLKTFDTYFKDRGIHAGTMNDLMNYITHLRKAPKCVNVPKVLGRLDPLLVAQAKDRARASDPRRQIRNALGFLCLEKRG